MIIREARANDVTAVRDLFVAVYGDNYGIREFYDTEWLTRFVYSDASLFLVAEDEGQIVGSASAILDKGDHDDLIVLLGRFVVHPIRQGRGLGRELAEGRLARVRERAHFVFAEVRTVHSSNQKLNEALGFAPVGFEPMRSLFEHRESNVLYARLYGDAVALRRNHPRLIPEAALIASTVLDWVGIRADVIVADDHEGWPTEGRYTFERLEASALPPLLRIARGRVSHRDVFGKLTLSHGFFQIATAAAQYIVARDGGVVVGGVGLTWHPHDRQVHIFELIGISDATKGALLHEADRVAHQEFGAAYVDIDVSAYSPELQRTLQRLGYTPIAYLPAMVFEQVERLDVVRMAKLSVAYDIGTVDLLPRPQRLREIVEQGLDGQRVVEAADNGTRLARIFEDLADGDRAHLARVAQVRSYRAGETLMREGEVARAVCVILSGAADVRTNGQTIGRVAAGETFGEIALVERSVRTADVVLSRDAEVLEFPIDRLEELLRTRPRLGMAVMRNLARGLGDKLRAARSPSHD